MNERETIMSKTKHTLYFALALALLVGCTDGVSEPDPIGLDTTLECPEGFVGWNFRTHPPQALNASAVQGSASNTLDVDADGGMSNPEVHFPVAIDIDSVSCDDDPVPDSGMREQDGDSTEEARRACNGRSGTCSFRVGCAQTGTRTITYNCGLGDIDPMTNEPRVRSITYNTSTPLEGYDEPDTWEVTCDLAVGIYPEGSVAPRSACVPRHCYGPSRRDELMNCVPDPTIPSLATNPEGRRTFRGVAALTPDAGLSATTERWEATPYEILEELEDSSDHGRLFVRATHQIHVFDRREIGVDTGPIKQPQGGGFSGVRYATPYPQAPRGSRLGVDIENTTTHTLPVEIWLARREEASSGKYTYLCSLGRRNIAPTTDQANNTRRITLDVPDVCGTSFDRDGRPVNTITSETPVYLMVSTTPEIYLERADNQCAIDPPAFYYDATTGETDMAAYYLQTLVAVDRVILNRASYAIGLFNARLAGSSMVSINSRPNRTISIALEHDLDFIGHIPLREGQLPRDLGNSEFDYSLRVYWTPSGASEPTSRRFRLGRVRVDRAFTADESGRLAPTTLRTELEIPRDVRRRLMELGLDTASATIEAEWRPSGEIETHDANRGGRGSDTPAFTLIFDRLHEPVFGQGPLWPGGGEGRNDTSSNEQTASMQQVEPTCGASGCERSFASDARSGGDISQSIYTVEAAQTETRGDGGVMSARTAPMGEIAGVMAVDPGESDNIADPPSAGELSEPIEITIEPDWDGIRTGLNNTTRVPPALIYREWVGARYAGVSGLGLGLGVKGRFSIGPLPVEFVALVSVGAGVALKIGLQFAPDEDEDEAYPCLRPVGAEEPDGAYPAGSAVTQGCLVIPDERLSYAEASDYCADRGGRLAEANTAAEAAALEALAETGGSLWIGAQFATYHPNPQCMNNYSASQCGSGLRTSVRWLSTGDHLAEGNGVGPLSYTGGTLLSLGRPAITPVGTAPHALAMFRASAGATATFVPAPMSEERNFVCQYRRAHQADFFKASLGVEVAAGAGAQLAICSPSDSAGVCLTANLTFIAAKITPTISTANHYLTFPDDENGIAGQFKVEIPWEIRALEGVIQAEVRIPLLFTTLTFSWPVVKYDGHVIAEGSLYEYTLPYYSSL